jgi:carboxypeptidase family protein/TonB-dependent receptor-like protein
VLVEAARLASVPAEVAMFKGGCVLGFCAALALTVVPASSRAQAALANARLVGAVRDSTGVPVPSAIVASSGLRALTDTGGRFALPGLPLGTVKVSIRRLGFEPRDTAVVLTDGRVDSLLVVLVVIPQELAGITTEAETRSRRWLSEFHRRRQGNVGTFLDRKQIEERHVQRISDLMRRLPGVRVGVDRNGRQQMRMGRASGGRDCPPDFWIDGVRATGLNVDDVPLQDVEALEIYKGPSGIPPELNSRFGNPGCGAVVIWTRVPG